MYKKLEKCKFCATSFLDLNPSQRANHTRWCKLNPKLKEYKNNKNAILAMNAEESKIKRAAGISKAHKEGKYSHIEYGKSFLGKNHTKESKKKISDAALNSNHRRLVRSIRPYTKKDGNVVMLDSSWEEVLATRLDELNIRWIRPEIPVKYIDDLGKTRKYFPDFYLLDYDLFLDPKNPFAYKVQKKKLDIICKMMSNLKLIITLDECKKFKL